MMVVVFRSRIRPENAVEFNALADQLMPMAESMPGFVSYKVFVADDGERCSIIEFETAGELLAWRELAEHRQAQALGRERYYESYSLQVAEVDRESRFDRKGEGA
jgi:heme-degrading monooxygenase HmoA